MFTGKFNLGGTLVLALASLPTLVHGNKFGWFKASNIGASSPPSGNELVVKLVSALEEQQYPGYEHAVALLDRFGSQTSCTRQALAGLVASCSDLDVLSGNSNDQISERTVDSVQSMYAARLALCELSVISPEILPLACASVFSPHFGESPDAKSTSEHKSHQFFTSGPASSSSQHDSCLQAIHEDTRSWISYSNNIQNSRAICEVSKRNIEKDEALKLHRSLLEVTKATSKSNTVLLNNLKVATDKVVSILASVEDTKRVVVEQGQRTKKELNAAYAQVSTLFSQLGSQSLDNLQKTQALSAQVNAINHQQDITMRTSSEHNEILRSHMISISKLMTALDNQSGNILERMGKLDAASQQVIPQFLEYMKKVNKSAAIIDDSYIKGTELKQIMTDIMERSKVMAVSQEVAHNQTMVSYNNWKDNFDNDFFGAGPLFKLAVLIIRSFITWFHHLPSVVIATGYFTFLMLIAMLSTMAGRKLASLPLRIITAPIGATLAFTASAPLPVPVIMSVISVYFGVFEQPGAFIARMAQLDFFLSDVILLNGIVLPVLIYTIMRVLESAKAEAIGLPGGAKGGLNYSD